MTGSGQVIVLQAPPQQVTLAETLPLWCSALAAIIAVAVALYVHHDSKKPNVVASLRVNPANLKSRQRLEAPRAERRTA